MSKQSEWKTSTGFILASAGSAIGLGAMWKFPYMAGIYGGGAFLLMFLIFTIFVGLPLLIMEFTVGKMGRTYTNQIYLVSIVSLADGLLFTWGMSFGKY